jgi:hypothetical protein
MNSFKEELKKTYLEKWDAFKSEMQKMKDHTNYDSPHLLSTTEQFETKWRDADLKLMIFGINTNGWGDNKNIYSIPTEEAVKTLMDQYENFYFGNGNWKYGQVFWNYFYCFEELLKAQLGKKVSILWNNLYKTSPQLLDIENKHFNFALDEIEIFKPNVIMMWGSGEIGKFHEKLSGNPVNFVDYEVWHKGGDEKDDPFLYYDMDRSSYNKINESVKKIIVTYHPNARGGGGMKIKLMMDELIPKLKEILT